MSKLKCCRCGGSTSSEEDAYCPDCEGTLDRLAKERALAKESKPVEKTVYVVGFLFVGAEVVLIQKRRPDWQAGKLNGVGGHVEVGETPGQAIAREFTEETGDAQPINWENFACLQLEDCVVHFYRASVASTIAHTNTDETICRVPVDRLSDYKIISNLKWLIPLAKSGDCFYGNYFPATRPVT